MPTSAKIYIMFGINELGTGTSESFVEYYQSVVQQICQMQPDAIVYVQSIINVAASAETDVISNANINEKNALLSQIADNKQVFYIDLNPSLVDSSGYLNSDYTSDGIQCCNYGCRCSSGSTCSRIFLHCICQQKKIPKQIRNKQIYSYRKQGYLETDALLFYLKKEKFALLSVMEKQKKQC